MKKTVRYGEQGSENMEIEETAKTNRGKHRGKRSPKEKKHDKWLKELEEIKNEIKRKQRDKDK